MFVCYWCVNFAGGWKLHTVYLYGGQHFVLAYAGFPLSNFKKNSRTFQDPWERSQDCGVTWQCLKIKMNSSFLCCIYNVIVPWSGRHKRNCLVGSWAPTLCTFIYIFSRQWRKQCCVILFWTTNSRTLTFNFQDYPSPNSFSRTFQVPVNSEKISRCSKRRGNPESGIQSPILCT